LVEDNPADVELVVEALQEHEASCEVLVVTDGEQAETFLDEIDAGKQSCPDLFILDLNLPRKPGTGYCQVKGNSTHGTTSCSC
jgi:DNA-binding response OmpR family regulator